MTKILSSLPRYMALMCACVIILLPFHAFLTVWLSSGVGHYTLLRLWKEVLLLLLFLGCVELLATRDDLRRACRGERLIGLITAYVVFVSLIGFIAYLAGGVSLKAYAYGVLLDTRYLVFFEITWAVTLHDDLLIRFWKQILLIPAGIVSVFAVLQYAVLPIDVLRHFGYRADTIPPVATIDQKVNYHRAQSTLRGPNPLGAYLVLILSALGVLLVRTRQSRLWTTVLYVLSFLALIFTFSRSAWLGTLLAMAVLILLTIRSSRLRKYLLVAAGSFVVVFALVGYGLRNNDQFQNIFFHTNEQSKSAESSNEGHVSALKNGLGDIVHTPWGSGTGTAGPASVYNKFPPRIAENYYVQIGQEIGVIGLAAFVLINIMVARRLWERRADPLALTLLVSFAGLALVNLLLHAWADDTLAYIWWGLAGAAVAIPLKREGKRENSK
jgi:O-antigen ligase